MKPYLPVLLLMLLPLAANAATDQEPHCPPLGTTAVQCFDVAGTLWLQNGTPAARLRQNHPRRTLGVAAVTIDDNETFNGPADLRARVDFDHPLTGGFRVCPLPAAAFGLPSVCIAGYRP